MSGAYFYLVFYLVRPYGTPFCYLIEILWDVRIVGHEIRDMSHITNWIFDIKNSISYIIIQFLISRIRIYVHIIRDIYISRIACAIITFLICHFVICLCHILSRSRILDIRNSIRDIQKLNLWYVTYHALHAQQIVHPMKSQLTRKRRSIRPHQTASKGDFGSVRHK